MLLTLDDFEREARRKLPRSLFGFAANGAERGASVHANTASFEKWQFVPNSLVDVSAIQQDRSIFGLDYSSPIGIAPMGGCALFSHRADLAFARAAAAEGVPFILSAASSVPIEEVMAHAPDTWYQGYVPGEESKIDALLVRLHLADVKVLVITVDVPVPSNRDMDKRLGVSVPLRVNPRLAIDGLLHPRWLCGTFLRTLLQDGIPLLPNFTGTPSGTPIIAEPTPQARVNRNRLTWKHIRHIRNAWDGALMIKGIVSSADARMAIQLGADGLIVSNHGGRQLDGAIAPLDVLGEIVDVAREKPVCLDGAIRRGTDVLKSLALGAHMVFVGRPMLYSLVVNGESGVRSAIGILKEEIACDMALLGCPALDSIRPCHVYRT